MCRARSDKIKPPFFPLPSGQEAPGVGGGKSVAAASRLDPPPWPSAASGTAAESAARHRYVRRSTRRDICAAVLVPALLTAGICCAERLDGLNVIATPSQPFGSAPARLSLDRAKRIGAKAVAIVPFLWQSEPASADIVRGTDMPDSELRAAIRQAHSVGLAAIVKPHVWVPQSWAGAVAPASEDGWKRWFARYAEALAAIAQIASEERAEALAIGTELQKTTHRGEWAALVAKLRANFGGTLTYFAHNAEEAESIGFWPLLDAIGVTLYPALGRDDDRTGRLEIMRAVAQRLDALASRTGKPVLVGEIGLRSALDAAAKPWESAEERASSPDPLLQAEVLADWLAVLDRRSVGGVLIWRWFTDPEAGGPADTDFTVQGKPAEGVLLCAWTARCAAR